MIRRKPQSSIADSSSSLALTPPSSIGRRDFCAASISMAGMSALLPLISVQADASQLGSDSMMRSGNDPSIRPFEFHATDAALSDLRRRIGATKWPSRELVADASQGVQLATTRELARHWQKDYDWRRFEARLNAMPQFMTSIDGIDIHFIHVRSNIRMHWRSLSRMVGRAPSSSS